MENELVNGWGCPVNRGNQSLVVEGCVGRGSAKWVLSSGPGGWVGAEHCLMKRSRRWLGKCLIFTANCRDFEGLAKRSDLCPKDMWEACGRSDYNLSTSRFHACAAPSTMGGLPSLPPHFPSGKGMPPQTRLHQTRGPPVTRGSAWGGRAELEGLTLWMITKNKGWL